MGAMSKETYTTREAAELLSVSLRTVQLWVENGTLSAWKTAGGHRRISRESLDGLVTEQYGALNNNRHDKTSTILVIEDDLDLLELYKLRIELWDLPVNVQTAVSGYEGLIKIGEHLPEFIIIDLVIPNMNGFQIIETLMSKYKNENMHIIVISSLTDEDIKEKGGLDKSIERLHKPVSFEKLHHYIVEKMSDKTVNMVV